VGAESQEGREEGVNASGFRILMEVSSSVFEGGSPKVVEYSREKHYEYCIAKEAKGGLDEEIEASPGFPKFLKAELLSLEYRDATAYVAGGGRMLKVPYASVKLKKCTRRNGVPYVKFNCTEDYGRRTKGIVLVPDMRADEEASVLKIGETLVLFGVPREYRDFGV